MFFTGSVFVIGSALGATTGSLDAFTLSLVFVTGAALGSTLGSVEACGALDLDELELFDFESSLLVGSGLGVGLGVGAGVAETAGDGVPARGGAGAGWGGVGVEPAATVVPEPAGMVTLAPFAVVSTSPSVATIVVTPSGETTTYEPEPARMTDAMAELRTS